MGIIGYGINSIIFKKSTGKFNIIMAWNKSYCDEINLFVEGKILPSDAKRQDVTAREIVKRLQHQPGLILADEVGMGKTFVALSVAVSVSLSDEEQRPVVVMIPSSLKEKWPKDFEVFVEKNVLLRT